MTPQPSLAPPPHRNRRLFSDHYLDVILPGQAEWRLGAAGAADTLAEVRALLADFVPSPNEAQTEADLIRPVLALLGHDAEVQPTLKTPDGTKRPDYVLYRDAAARSANKGIVLADSDLAHALAVADAKYWERPLDQALKVGVDPFTNKNPGYQIAFYVQHTGLPWGILTNGRLWRLYHRDTAHKLDTYYEVDLPELVEQGDPARFQYFLRFFERAAFDAGPLSLARHLEASAVYARSVGDSLRDQVYDALLHVAQGFLDFPGNRLEPEPATLKEAYDNALILLYRLLFVLYAEARELLPVETSAAYRDSYSLRAISRGVARDLGTGQRLLSSTATLWPRLTALFEIINRGSPPLHVATFNGGLFDPERHPFLERHAVGDAHLQQAIDKLARVQGEFVDYRDLSERHLGTIYEGLLEFHLRPMDGIAEKPSGTGAQAFQPAYAASFRSETPPGRSAGHSTDDPANQGWTVRLVTDKGERKSSGSYYTPGFITRFMVEQALGPVVDAALARSAASGPAAQIQAVLDVNVLDCAMGSGHFLVEAVEYLARRLVEADLLAADPQAAAGADELAHWKRRVAQSCVYGVDLNPLAVDLAKLSLWLTTAAKDRPLSFLDHHLHAGNALVGAWLKDLGGPAAGPPKKSRRAAAARATEAEGQLTLLADDAFRQSMKLAVDSMWLIEESPAATVADVKAQEQQYAEVREAFTRRYRRVADLAAAVRFGLKIDPALWQPLADYAAGRSVAAVPQFDAWLAEADRLAEQHRFFHWELEFPEVFFDRFGRPLGDDAGFEVVIGNPPYVRQEKIAPLKPYLQTAFTSFHSAADLYLFFYEQGLKLLRSDGRLAYVSSGTFARANFAVAFRSLLPTMASIETLVDFGENQPFEGAEMVRPSIAVLRKAPQVSEFRSLFIADQVPASLEGALSKHGFDCAAETLQLSEWVFQPSALTRLSSKVLGNGVPLLEAAKGRLYRGVLTGLNEAFIVDQSTRDQLVAADTSCASILKPALRGEDLRPWYQEDEGRWMIVLPCGWTRATSGSRLTEQEGWAYFERRHPALAAHLLPFARLAMERLDKGEFWWELRACAYLGAFEETKIFWPDIAKLPRFSWDDQRKFINNKGYIIPLGDPALLGLLQSRVLWFAVSQICQPLRLRAGLWQYQMFTQFTSRLPIPDTVPPEREAIGSLAMHTTELARERYALHQRTRHRIWTDLGEGGGALNQKLTAWWDLDFPTFRAELRKVFRREIPVQDRDDWETLLATRRADHDRLTGRIVALDTELNDRVYRLFGLTPDEIRIIEETTKYRYGEV